MSKSGRKILLLWLLVGWFFLQKTEAQLPVFQSIKVKEDGKLTSARIFQGKDGWIWLSDGARLLRFDGHVSKEYQLPEKAGANAEITAISAWHDTLWIGCSNGKICFLPQIFQRKTSPQHLEVQLWQPDEGTPNRAITGFAADSQDNFWFSTYGEGIYCQKNKRIFQLDSHDDHLASDEVYALAADAAGNIFAATDNGISICGMSNDGKKSVQHFSKAEGLPDEIVTALCPTPDGNIWFGTDQSGVCLYDFSQKKIIWQTQKWQFGQVTRLAVAHRSELWIGTKNNGLLRLDWLTQHIEHFPDGHPLRRDHIQHLLTDLEGGLWVIAEKSGVFRANRRYSFLPTSYGSVHSICRDQQNQLWLGTRQGLFLSQREQFRQVLPQQQHIISLFEASDGNIWAGSFGNGVFVVSPSGRLLHHFSTQNGLTDDNILSIAGTENEIWLATLAGVTRVQLPIANSPLRKPHFSKVPALGSNYVYKVWADRRGRVWFGTDGSGLIKFENEKFEKFTSAVEHPIKTVLSIAEDKQGNIWFSALQQGLFCFDGQNFRHFGKSESLHSLDLQAVAVAGSDELVLIFSDAIQILQPQTGHLTTINQQLGISTAEFELNSTCTDTHGNVWVGTSAGVWNIQSDSEQYIFDPKTHINSVNLFEQGIHWQSLNKFAYDENYFSFDFIGLWYAQPSAVRYRYRLEGFDPDWKISREHTASYPNLSPGTYTFRVQTSEHGRFEGTEEVIYSFTICPPIWRQWWFGLGVAITVIFFILKWIKIREARLRREEELNREKIISQFETLKSQINPHFLFNSFNTLIAIIEESPRAAVEYVEQLSDFFRTIMVYREKDHIPIAEELELVQSFYFLLKKRYENNLTLSLPPAPVEGWVMPMSLQMLVENAVKHNIISKNKPLHVEIFVENNHWIVVKNKLQRKMTHEPSTRFGLQGLIKRYQLLGAQQVQVQELDSFFCVKIPILKTEQLS